MCCKTPENSQYILFQRGGKASGILDMGIYQLICCEEYNSLEDCQHRLTEGCVHVGFSKMQVVNL